MMRTGGDGGGRPETTQPGATRRHLLTWGSLAVAGGILAGCSDDRDAAPADPGSGDGDAVPAVLTAEQPEPDDAWIRLAVGNDRFAGGKAKHPRQGPKRRQVLAEGQRPFACVLGCVDSRVPPEVIFDQGLGDLLTVRSAGEVLDDAVIGSIEYAVTTLETPLVVVLGHTDCGAVKAAVDLVRKGRQVRGNVSSVVRSIEAAVRATKPASSPEAFLARCVAEQADRVVLELRERSPMIDGLVQRKRVRLMAAGYDVRTGYVTATAADRN